MHKFKFPLLILAVALIIFGCSSTDPEPEPEPEVFDPPTSLVYLTYQDSVRLSWTASVDESETGFLGYLVYRRENAGFSGLSNEDLAGYLVSADHIGGVATTITGIPSDRKHFFTVRAIKIVGSDTTLSALANTVDTSPTIWFSDTIWEVAGGTGVMCAIDFDNQIVYPMELTYLTQIDIYLGVEDSNRLALKSPSLFGTEWSDRTAEVKRLGVPIAGLASFNSAGTTGWTNERLLYPGESYAVKIGSNYSKIFVEGFTSGVYPNRGIIFSAAYQNVDNYDRF
jgi:hypothetical protein